MEQSFHGGLGCPDVGAQLAGLLDNELPLHEAQRLELHVLSCPRCAVDLARQRTAQAALRRVAPALLPPASLRIRLQGGPAGPAAGGRVRRWLLVVGGLAAALLVLAALTLLLRSPRAPEAAVLVRAASAHQEQTLGTVPVDFASRDPETVAAWARARTGRQVEVPSLETAGYRLLGARLDPDVAPNAVALVYEGQSGRMTCTILQNPERPWARLPLPERSSEVQVTQIADVGLASWSEGESAYVMAANLDRAQMLQLAQLVARTSRSAPSPAAGPEAARLETASPS